MPQASNPNSDGSDISKAVALLKRTLPEMNRRNIATTPENYAVWYEYVNGENHELISAIEELEANRTAMTSEVHRELYNRFIASAREAAVNKLSESVREVINELLSKIGSEGEGLSRYSHNLHQFSTQMDAANDADEIRSLIRHLIEETHKREEATRQMQDSLATMADEMKQLRAEIARLNSEATTDSLTKVNNRRAFDMEIENLISASKMENRPLCMLLLDIDHFKQFNDKFGHMIGDKVLRFVATLLKKNVKGSDMVARFGGEEFAILLPETDYTGAISVAENIRDKLAKQTLSDSAEKMQLGTITVSIGAACYQYGELAEELIHRADTCMYEAKRQGRNRVIGEQQLSQNDTGSQTFI
ncbi:MAG: GGDEF domain-containing protein [Oleiphilaceae bacterium]|nr:GGDEF domain-containing protein [Oleiphilaceae bacterium]